MVNLSEEKKLWRKGYKFVAGLDEAGRGPLAGPVAAAAVCFSYFSPPQMRRGLRGGVEINQHPSLASLRGPASPEPQPASRQGERSGLTFPKLSLALASFEGREKLCQLRDSKQLSSSRREEWYKILTSHPDIKWGVGIVSEKIIDKINIFEATKLAMKKAVENLGVEADYLLLDGNFGIQIAQAHTNALIRMVPYKSIIKGDEKVFSCAAASIIAKVTRDRLMLKYHKKYPLYGFDRHKGYGTAQHLAALKKYGACAIHRRSFRPIVNSDWRLEISE